jgi:2-oxoisovalerate dehydrogenase E1 component alpha subunit
MTSQMLSLMEHAEEQSLGLTKEDLVSMYRTMLSQRLFDERCMNLQRSGRIKFYVPSAGQEACQVGSGWALREDDWVFPAYRELGVALVRRVPLTWLINQFFGNKDDLTKGRQMPNHYGYKEFGYLSPSSPIATQIPHAVGAAYAFKLQKKDRVSIVYFGDGATSEGDFHTGMNFAGAWKTPTIFFCQNNQWAISCPTDKQTGSETFAQKAIAYGFEGIRVDGNDVLAVYAATKDAAAKARSGGGPTMIEAYTYRLGPHSTSDDPRRYHPGGWLEEAKAKDPIPRFRAFLEKRGLWSDDEQKEHEERSKTEVNEAIKNAESLGPPPVRTLFDDVYGAEPASSAEQREELRRFHETRW